MKPRRRLDRELVRRELVGSIEEATEHIGAGRVTVNGAPTTNAGRAVAASETIRLLPAAKRFVSRGGEKLAGALDGLGVDVAGRVALDVGSSTGGFSDCLLQAGAASVTCVDVGYGLLAEPVRSDPRTVVAERTNIRHLPDDRVTGPFDVVVGDLSFISLRAVVDPIMALAAPGATMLLLVKPQFESTRDEASRHGGVITDDLIRRRTVEEVVSAFGEAGAAMMGTMQSPILGAGGNAEFFVHLRAPAAMVEGDG